jgi:hypothetical protein
MKNFNPNLVADEQMSLFDTRNTLLYQIREELKSLNQNLSLLNKPPESTQETKPKLKKSERVNANEKSNGRK